MKKHLMLVKVGGGFITEKSQPMTPNMEAVKHIAVQLADAHRRHTDIDMIIGNGVGSYAHFTAHEYGLREGAKDARGFYGAAKTHHNAQKISSLFAKELLEHNVPAFSFSPASMLVSGLNKAFFTESLQQALDSGVVPIVHGDTIFDTKQGIKIFSTEKILQECLEGFRSKYEKIQVIYFVNTKGIYDVEGNTIQELLPDEPIPSEVVHKHDVTGGIEGKVASARLAAKTADGVFITYGWLTKPLDMIIEDDRWSPSSTRIR